MKHIKLRSPAGLVLFLTWLLFGMYYVNRFNYSPVIPLLKADLGISNTQAGWLLALFFLTYTIFQLPAGYLGDHFGPRKILTYGALTSIVGNLIFSQATTFGALSVGQLANGLGQSMGWASSLKLIVNWFPRARRATAIGLFATCVTGGSSLGIWISGLLGDHRGWRSSFIVPPVLMIIVALIYALGSKGFFIEIRGGVTLIMAFLMIFMGKWNRRSRVMTQAEWMKL